MPLPGCIAATFPPTIGDESLKFVKVYRAFADGPFVGQIQQHQGSWGTMLHLGGPRKSSEVLGSWGVRPRKSSEVFGASSEVLGSFWRILGSPRKFLAQPRKSLEVLGSPRKSLEVLGSQACERLPGSFWMLELDL